ncbi:hypothetical protein [Winogradskyella eximia]|uniref:hypothetical protein n=1 Tax=Winogradskyella eximia TaxID=262006 RepID=UPI0024939C4A|nr:hypothetical protein [Winogradskyella eximia]
MMKLAKEDIQFIDKFLFDKGIKHIDVRTELIDHLASDYEEHSQIIELKNYLNSKNTFIDEFTKKHKSIVHWRYQKLLWIVFFQFFYKIKQIFILLGFLAISYLIAVEFSIITAQRIYSTILISFIIYALIIQIKDRKVVKNTQLAQSLFVVMSLPSVFFYLSLAIKDTLQANPFVMYCYFTLAILLAYSAITLIKNERLTILNRYNELVN